MKVYVGMVELANGEDKPKATNIFCAGLNKENVKKRLLEQACDVLKDFGECYVVERDQFAPEDSVILKCTAYPRWIRYFIRDVDLIDGKEQ